MRDLSTLPKAHLHLHLDGAIRQDTLREECERGGVAPPPLPPGRSYGSFEVFTATITACHHILSSPQGLRRVMG